jgi:hypothetical protein
LNALNINKIENLVSLDRQLLINEYFPKNTQSCHNFYGGDCTFVDVCHSNQTIEEGLENGFFSSRIPHHELEEKDFKEKGKLK